MGAKVQRKADHERSAERVHMEREVMVDARHPLVAPLYAAFQDRLYLYLDMEYCPGGSLDNFVRCVCLLCFAFVIWFGNTPCKCLQQHQQPMG